MDKIIKLLEEYVNEQLYQIIISNPNHKGSVTKLKIRPLMHKGELCYQVSSYVGTQVLHANYQKKELIQTVAPMMTEQFKQTQIESTLAKITVLISQKGKMTIQKKQITNEIQRKPNLMHNRVKKYILQEGVPVAFLIDLGIQNAEGKILPSRYDKFKQINRFLEFIQDILPILQQKDEITILDFGCGKSYLTFAMYYYFTVLQQMQVHITGLDLKADVIRTCTKLKEKYQYENLEFLQGDIGTYTGVKEVDMVVTLHACDTATDYALQKAILWNARVILSVPCCQHEVNQQIHCDTLASVFQYGLIKERMSALFTDAIRANLLQAYGYETQILEFIDMEHTPKNILIRAVRHREVDKREVLIQTQEREELDALMSFLHVHPTLVHLLQQEAVDERGIGS
ncbi:MAG: SAM-dependent methyltransferase [Lachnospiraceae bacterium]